MSADWQTKLLRDLATINYGRSPAGILADDGDYPVVGTGGSDRKGTDFLHDGDSIILGRKGTIDRVHYATGRFWTIDTAYYLSDFEDNLPRWLYYFFQTLDLRQMNEATGVPSLSRDLLYKIEIPTPPVPEQTKIAEILSTVDRAIEQTEALIAKQQRLKTGLMQDLLTRGIDEHGNLRSEQTHPFKDSPLGRIPVAWEVKECASICKHIVVGIVIRPVQYYRPDGVPMLRSANVRENRIDPRNLVFMDMKDNDKMSKSQVMSGDLVTVRTGYPGTTAVVPPEFDGCNCIDIVISRPDSTQVRSEFLSIWINSDHGKRQVLEGQGGVAQQHFNVGEMKTLLVKMPPVSEQEQIERTLLKQAKVTKDLENSLAKLRSLKTALMQDLLSGRKRVTALLDGKESGT
ncbi:MAG: restriction endonuclease subunit S [Verrucomicrobia bacterium]|nr:restriction endonuclease subunit S [Verrucomicrobiota bacterium]